MAKLLKQIFHIISDLLTIEILPLGFRIGRLGVTQTSCYFAQPSMSLFQLCGQSLVLNQGAIHLQDQTLKEFVLR
ncbi:MAG: hypothetical protein AUJ21_11385 [Anaerolineae bacterium CG1_02_58_13]|nr:MAG: hypothetical protein AUJ21_11385 [Anaerolineae bacterium CG1_02_58_13]